MSIIPGSVPFAGFIAPTDSTDTFPVFKPIYGLGGLRTVDTVADRDAISTARREQGMLVYTKADNSYYQLASGLTNSDWSNLNLTNGGSSYPNQFSVTASGTNAYSGVSTPTITGYSMTDLYLTQFDNTNTLTATTLDINGYGPLSLLKGTDDGLASLDVGEIQTGVTYFLTYDGTQFQFFTSSPVGTPGTYTSLLPATVTVGGITIGTTFSGATWQSIFDTMFHPTLTPNYTTFLMSAQSTTLEVGNSVSGGTRAFTWSVSNQPFVLPNSIKIYNYSAGNTLISVPASGITGTTTTITGLANTQKIVQATHTWRTIATRTNFSTFSRDFTVGWYWRRMQGVSSATTISTSAGVNVFSGTGALATSIVGTYALNGAGYKYFFVPTTFGFPSLFKDASTQLAVSMADATDNSFFSGVSGSYSYGTTPVTNQFGITQNYRVYRTRNFLNGNITITVS
jgi:hypothetical protein